MIGLLLSPHISLGEAKFSSVAERLGIDNSNPSIDVILSAKKTAAMMEKIRTLLGNTPIHIDSFIRCLALNRALRSADTSQHLLGEACDFVCPTYGTPLAIAQKIIQNVAYVDYDQLIWEHSWIHISRNSRTNIQRHNVLTLMHNGSYSVGLVEQ